jgi:hypothetical protein
MDGPNPTNTAPAAHLVQEPDTAGRRRRQLVESAALVGELTTVLIADSRQLIARSNNVIARPHMVVKTSADTAPAARQTIVCERCGLGIDTPGVAIMRGRNVMHVRCDAHIGKGA